MIRLTDEQEQMLLLAGMPCDGSRNYVVVDGERISNELMALGLVHKTGPNSMDLTGAGEQVYEQLTRMGKRWQERSAQSSI